MRNSDGYGRKRRQDTRESDGTYAKGNVCEACGKSAPLADYQSNPYSLQLSSRGLVLCTRKRCIQYECPEEPQAAVEWFKERERILRQEAAG
jgi:hypothetical protein